MNNTNYTEEKVIEVNRYSEKLITFKITRPLSYQFQAGQFSRLGMYDGGGYIWRAYSIMSAEYDDYLDFLAILIPDGKMSHKLKNIKENDVILLDHIVQGFFLPFRFVGGKVLIMLATGSGVAPFMSHLQNQDIWEKFEHIYLVHSVSYASELISLKIIDNLTKENKLIKDFLSSNKFTFIPVVTREKIDNIYNKRIPLLLEDKDFCSTFKYYNKEDTRMMICGNPDMVKATFNTLYKQGFSAHRNKAPGNIIMENGF